jgi:hypothetical protein
MKKNVGASDFGGACLFTISGMSHVSDIDLYSLITGQALLMGCRQISRKGITMSLCAPRVCWLAPNQNLRLEFKEQKASSLFVP